MGGGGPRGGNSPEQQRGLLSFRKRSEEGQSRTKLVQWRFLKYQPESHLQSQAGRQRGCGKETRGGGGAVFCLRTD